jgi:hypothetical protein
MFENKIYIKNVIIKIQNIVFFFILLIKIYEKFS